jgi:hypothetical protein
MYPSMICPGSLQQETDNDPILDETLLARLTISEALQPEGDDSGEVTEDVSESVERTCQNSEDSTSGDSNPETVVLRTAILQGVMVRILFLRRVLPRTVNHKRTTQNTTIPEMAIHKTLMIRPMIL